MTKTAKNVWEEAMDAANRANAEKRERFEHEAEKVLVALVNTELTILPALKGEKEAALRALIWRANDVLKEKRG